MKHFYIIRHGETNLNKLGIVQGRGINSDLNEKGRLQAFLFYEQYKDLPFDKIYTSTLKRTHQTVQLFIDQGIPWEQLAGLDEMAWGRYEGMETSVLMKGRFKQLLANWQQGKLDEHLEGGESPLDVNRRQREALAHMVSQATEQNVLICMHGRAIRLFLCLLSGVSLSEMDTFPHQNLSLYRVDYDGTDFSIVAFNDLVHLESDLLER